MAERNGDRRETKERRGNGRTPGFEALRLLLIPPVDTETTSQPPSRLVGSHCRRDRRDRGFWRVKSAGRVSGSIAARQFAESSVLPSSSLHRPFSPLSSSWIIPVHCSTSLPLRSPFPASLMPEIAHRRLQHPSKKTNLGNTVRQLRLQQQRTQ